MQICKEIEIVDKTLGIFLRKFKALVIADLHIGYEAALEKQGIQIPKSQYPKIKKTVEEMLEICDPSIVIINGDVKHEFGEVTRQEWKEVLDFLDFLLSKKLKVVVIRGNHDNFLIPVLKRKGIELKDPYFQLGGFFFAHGHKDFDLRILKKEIKTVIIAHEHPAIVFRDELGIKRKFKCFLKGKLYEKKLIVLPALSPLMEGSEINLTSKKDLLSPILKVCDLNSFYALVVELSTKVYKFPLKYL